MLAVALELRGQSVQVWDENGSSKSQTLSVESFAQKTTTYKIKNIIPQPHQRRSLILGITIISYSREHRFVNHNLTTGIGSKLNHDAIIHVARLHVNHDILVVKQDLLFFLAFNVAWIRSGKGERVVFLTKQSRQVEDARELVRPRVFVAGLGDANTLDHTRVV